MNYDVFISYRRESGLDFAGRLVDHLKSRGFSPFMDLESMKSGRFDSQIYKKIDECKHFILVLSPNALKRCKNKEDWVRKEVEYALKAKKHIITIRMSGFSFPRALPDFMKVIRYVQAVFPSPDTFDHTVDKVVYYLRDRSWSADDYDNAIPESNDSTGKKKILKAIFYILAVLLLALSMFFMTKFFVKGDALEMQLMFKDANGEWNETETIFATVGDEIKYRIQVSDFKDDKDLILSAKIDKSLEIIPKSVKIKGIDDDIDVPIGEKKLKEGINLREFKHSNGLCVDFSVKVINYDLTMAENSLYTKIKLVNNEKTLNDYNIVQISFLDDAIHENTVTGWGDSSGGRNLYTASQVNDDHALGDIITFNSITDWEPIGDEKNFVATRKDSGVNEANVWHEDEIIVTEEGKYIVRMYVRNNNPNGEAATAEDVRASFLLPKEKSKTIGVSGFIESSNACPNRYWDGVTFKSNRYFYLDYVEGSAKMYNNGIGAGDGCPLRESLFSSEGVLLGYDKLDGKIPGGTQYEAYIEIKVRVVFPEDNDEFLVETKVRKTGEKEWNDELEVNMGDEVEYIINYKNTSNSKRSDIMVWVVPPSSVTYVKGSTVLYNSNHKEGINLPESKTSVTSTGINVGDYAVGSNAIILSKYKVTGSDKLSNGINKLRFWGQVDDGTTTMQNCSDLILKIK